MAWAAVVAAALRMGRASDWSPWLIASGILLALLYLGLIEGTIRLGRPHED